MSASSYFRAFFRACRNLLAEDGAMVVHSIGRTDGPGDTSMWIQRYIFPGGYIPAVSEVIPAVEKEKLHITDMEILRLHYAKTLRAWRERFLARREEVAALYDERFCRIWEFYLAASEVAFETGLMMNFQIQLTRNQMALPLTRDYMFTNEEALRARDGDSARAAEARRRIAVTTAAAPLRRALERREVEQRKIIGNGASCLAVASSSPFAGWPERPRKEDGQGGQRRCEGNRHEPEARLPEGQEPENAIGDQSREERPRRTTPSRRRCPAPSGTAARSFPSCAATRRNACRPV